MNTFKRFSLPLSMFRVDPMDKVIGAAKRCFNTPEGEILLKHLITEYTLDEPSGCGTSDEMAYRNGTQDVVKYILSLTNDK